MTFHQASLKKTPLNAAHRSLNARMVAFAGWDMPVEFSGVIDEHLTVRRAAGLFDVSHMGEILVEGSDALALLQRLTPNDVARLGPGQAHYSALTNDGGGFLDDLLVYRWGETRYLLVVNASNVDRDFEWIREHRRGGVEVRDVSADYALLALQGPQAMAILAQLTDLGLAELKYYHYREGSVGGKPTVVSRTGYTGEDGFELLVAARDAEALWWSLLGTGDAEGLKPIGLGARDTLRLEAKMVLYGNDIDEEHTVLEADLGWMVKLDKGDFIGRQRLARQRDEGVARKLVGFEMVERGIARPGYPVYVDGAISEPVTSGSYAPYLKKNIGLAYVPVAATAPGTELEVEIRGRRAKARVVKTPFYRRRKAV